MDPQLNERPPVSHGGESAAHSRLKKLALIWAQAHGYSACAAEVTLPRYRYRADVAAYHSAPKGLGSTAIFECKQALPDLRRDNCTTAATRERLDAIHRRRTILEKHLRVHYPNRRIPDSLFPEFDSHDFAAIGHRNYNRVLRELSVLQNRLYDCAKFEKLMRYGCANLFFLVLPNHLFREPEIPIGWGVLIENGDGLDVVRKPVWRENTPENTVHFLERIAKAGTRAFNRQLSISPEEILAARARSVAP